MIIEQSPMDRKTLSGISNMLIIKQCSMLYICIITKDIKPLIPVTTNALLPGRTWIEISPTTWIAGPPSMTIRDISLLWLNRSSSFFSVIHRTYYM